MFPIVIAWLLAAAPQNALTSLERDSGWELLFDGETTRGWRSYAKPGFPEQGWNVVDGCLHHEAKSGGGDIVFERPFADFELVFEWKLAAGANSGVKYRVPELGQGSGMVAPEFQILDDAAHPSAAPMTRAAALYGIKAPEGALLNPIREFNRTRIVARGTHFEHWLNGVRVLSTDTASDEWKLAVAGSKFAATSGFGQAERGWIGLQDHGDEVWFRSLEIRDLSNPPGQRVELLRGASLDGWDEIGDALWTNDGDSILGEVGGGGQSFLVTERTYGDFILEVDVKPELPGNSGIQVRSHVNSKGRLYGYQIEIDSSERAWSGGLYDEARRGWLQNLADNQAGREAFRYGEWNRYRIECIGPWIRVWLNGVPTADTFDTEDLEGVIGLQVHSGKNTRVRWRNPRLWDLGRREWVEGQAPIVVAQDMAVRFEARALDGEGAFALGDWSFALAPAESEWVPVALTYYGGRMTFHVSGKRVADVLLPLAVGELTCENIDVREVVVLGPAR